MPAKGVKKGFLVLSFVLLFSLQASTVIGQAAFENPVDYLNYLSQREDVLSRKYLSYMSEVAHEGRALKMEKLREDLLTSIREAISDAEKLRPYKGDVLLRGAFKEYWTILLSVFSEDYLKILDMEKIAEHSYDSMEAYLLAQEKANQRLEEAYAKIPPAYEAFAKRHNIRFSEAQSSRLSKRLEQAGKVNEYMNSVYLIFFKSTVQESLMMEAVQAHDLPAIEQCRNNLIKYSTQGLLKLDSVKPFRTDAALVEACRQVLEFHLHEARDEVTVFTEFLKYHNALEEMKKSLKNKRADQRTRSEVDAYNDLVNQYNRSLNDYQKTSAQLNERRAKMMTNWEATRRRFMDAHIPYKV